MEQKKERRSFGKWLIDGAYSILSFVVLVMLMWSLLFSFVLRTVVVDGISMQDTLQNKERMVLLRALYTPERGDIIVANRIDKMQTDRLNVSTYREPIIKRVIGLPGDVVEVQTDAVFVNGAKLDEPYVHYENSRAGTICYVPEGCVFVMGDHRNASTDSRHTGPVKMENLMGHVVARLGGSKKVEVLEDTKYSGIPEKPSSELIEKALKEAEKDE